MSAIAAIRKFVSFLVYIAIIYAAIAALMWAVQRSLLYYPHRQMGTPADHGLPGFTALTLRAEDGMRLAVWHFPARQGFPTVLYFHGNAGHLGYRQPIYATLAQAGFGVLALSYRGFGTSEGSPTEQGLYRDGRAAIAYARDALYVPPERLVLYGESLGTGVAVQMATEFPVGAVVLQAPFTSITDVAARLYPFMPVRMLIKDRFDSLRKMPRVGAPVLILHGERDTLIAPAYGRELLAAVRGPQHGVFFPDTGHDDFDPAAVTKALMDFTAEHGLIAETRLKTEDGL